MRGHTARQFSWPNDGLGCLCCTTGAIRRSRLGEAIQAQHHMRMRRSHPDELALEEMVELGYLIITKIKRRVNRYQIAPRFLPEGNPSPAGSLTVSEPKACVGQNRSTHSAQAPSAENKAAATACFSGTIKFIHPVRAGDRW